MYCLRCMVELEIPLNSGCVRPISIKIPKDSILNPTQGLAVCAGNVLTSQRITDVILRAFGAAAASQGCMNNFTFGNARFGYYETIAGGAGAGPGWKGSSGVHTHMTNTRMTDPEVFESQYPVFLREFSIREGSGGAGEFPGGNGVVREVQMLAEGVVASLLCERRGAFAPFGLRGGGSGQCGQNLLLRGRLSGDGGRKAGDGESLLRRQLLLGGGSSSASPRSSSKRRRVENGDAWVGGEDGAEDSMMIINLGGKNKVYCERGDIVRICTPGGGAYGEAKAGQGQAKDASLTLIAGTATSSTALSGGRVDF